MGCVCFGLNFWASTLTALKSHKMPLKHVRRMFQGTVQKEVRRQEFWLHFIVTVSPRNLYTWCSIEKARFMPLTFPLHMESILYSRTVKIKCFKCPESLEEKFYKIIGSRGGPFILQNEKSLKRNGVASSSHWPDSRKGWDGIVRRALWQVSVAPISFLLIRNEKVHVE